MGLQHDLARVCSALHVFESVLDLPERVDLHRVKLPDCTVANKTHAILQDGVKTEPVIFRHVEDINTPK